MGEAPIGQVNNVLIPVLAQSGENWLRLLAYSQQSSLPFSSLSIYYSKDYISTNDLSVKQQALWSLGETHCPHTQIPWALPTQCVCKLQGLGIQISRVYHDLILR